MTDYRHELWFGAGVVPESLDHEKVLDAIQDADDAGLDVVGVQDHPYQPGFLDTWTLLSYAAARTSRVRLFPNVINVPLRPPAVLARSAASLDILSRGRVELGLGAGAFLAPIASMGGPKRTIAQNVDALDEAITVIRSLWKTGPPVTFAGKHYHLIGARPGPPPQHAIGIWLGAYKRRMLTLTGRAADGWIPSIGYAALEELPGMNRAIDEAALAAGREPSAIRRAFNIAGRFLPSGSGFLQGPPAKWVDQLSDLALESGFSVFILAITPGSTDMRRFVEEVAPGVRERVQRERLHKDASPPPNVPVAVAESATAAEAAREAQRLVSEREDWTQAGRAGQQTLLAIHQHLRDELEKLLEVIDEVGAGRSTAADARSYLNEMTMRQNYWTLGAFCAAYCRVVSVHHAIEDQSLFPDLKAADQSLAPVLQRLQHEHEGIAHVLSEVDQALVAMVEDEPGLDVTKERVQHLRSRLLAHLQYEEEALLEPIGRLAIRI